MVDTLASGASGGNPVEVRVLFSVPLSKFKTLRNGSQAYLYNREHFGQDFLSLPPSCRIIKLNNSRDLMPLERNLTSKDLMRH